MNNIIVIFGATGDLMDKKISPALFNLNIEKPGIFHKIIGFGRRELSDDQFREMVKESVSKRSEFNKDQMEDLLKKIEYHKGEFHDLDSFKRLSQNVNSNYLQSSKHIYLAVPSELYPDILNNLGESGFIDPNTKLMVEKPIGSDLEGSLKLEQLFSKYFSEEQIYRIDHYLGKDSVQNILSFRFANSIFDPIWNNQFIEKIEIRAHEDIGVENRGSFYDKVGALRDFGQNHLLQLLALTTMDEPGILCCENIRDSRMKILKMLKKMEPDQIPGQTYRAQYESYKKISDVNESSNTETYFKVKCFIDSARWGNVPIYLENGKKLKKVNKEIMIHFKGINKVIFSLEPDDSIKIFVKTKKPGITFENEDNMISLNMNDPVNKNQYVSEYIELFYDFLMSDQTFFISREESEYMWRFVQPILDSWKNGEVPLEIYSDNSDGAVNNAYNKLNT